MSGTEASKLEPVHRRIPTPALPDLRVDSEGNPRAVRYRLPWEDGSTWSVLSSEGRWLGTPTLPPAVEVLDIEGDLLVGPVEAELGVERMVVHRIVR